MTWNWDELGTESSDPDAICTKSLPKVFFKGLINVDCQQFHEHHELYIFMLHILALAN